MHHETLRDRMRLSGKGALWIGGLAGAAAVAAFALQPAPRLHAAAPGPSNGSEDTDSDGLPDRLELLLGTSPDLPDSDGDGAPDAEELARGSDPLNVALVPGGNRAQVAVSAYLDSDGALHPMSFVYVPGGDFASNQLAMGVRVHNTLIYRPLSFFLATGTVKSVPASHPEDLLIAMNTEFSGDLVHRFGSLSFFTTLSEGGKVSSADAVNVFSVDGEILQLERFGLGGAPAPASGGQFSGAIYKPLEPNGGGSNWIPNSICAQGLSTVGSTGAVVVQEVTSAECQSGWDAFCDPGCSGTVGATVRTVDPGALIGG